MPDYLRLFSLFGIVVNVQYIAFSALHGVTDAMAACSSVTRASRALCLTISDDDVDPGGYVVHG
jgi:hypothetical protein